MIAKNKDYRQVLISDKAYRFMRLAAKAERRTFSEWAADRLLRALLETPVGRANTHLWED